jgi:hypothetical protein
MGNDNKELPGAFLVMRVQKIRKICFMVSQVFVCGEPNITKPLALIRSYSRSGNSGMLLTASGLDPILDSSGDLF